MAEKLYPEESPKKAEDVSQETETGKSKKSSRVVKRTQAEKKKKASKIKRRLVSAVGALFVLFASIGVATTIYFSTIGIRNIVNSTSEKTRYENFLRPVIMLDPVHFSSASKASQSFLIQSSLWHIVWTKDTSQYAISEMGDTIIPYADVELAAAELFGEGITLVHQSIGDINSGIIYDEETENYFMALYGTTGYSPLVAEIQRRGETVTLSVGYIPPTPDWLTGPDGKKATAAPVKFAYYVLKDTGKNVTLTAINEIPEDEQLRLIGKFTKQSASSQS